jgi:hypothetical protein
MLKHVFTLIHLLYVLNWYALLEALKLLKIKYRHALVDSSPSRSIRFLFYLEFRYAILSREMNH